MKSICLRSDVRKERLSVKLSTPTDKNMKLTKFNSILQENICGKDIKLTWKSKSSIEQLMEKPETKLFYLSYITEPQEMPNQFGTTSISWIYQTPSTTRSMELSNTIYTYWTSCSMTKILSRTHILSLITSIKGPGLPHPVKNTSPGLSFLTSSQFHPPCWSCSETSLTSHCSQV